MKILLVGKRTEVIKAHLSSEFEIAGMVEHGGAAMTWLHKNNNQVDAIIAEAIMSHLDAAGLCQRIQADSNLKKKPPIVAVGGRVNDSYLTTLFTFGIAWYQMFPVEAHCFQENIKRVVNPPMIQAQPSLQPAPQEKRVFIEEVVSEKIRELGCPAHIKGYVYIREALIKWVKDPVEMSSITKVLYPTIARQFGTAPSRVERAIRHAIETMWKRGNQTKLEEVFGYTVSANKGKPTNSEFLALIADNIRQEFRRYTFVE